ncbi:hypothetical protein [Rhizosaccharibacter radicis]|uniref:Translation initiation factor IF-2 n=1 Tax=Rhizosaccharibacter radicis TaxID=2782605 RepID=A0ABT1VZ76_9PROT|nr:hypothetical protein [Acetobacteraceae bacterium KSS12]
MTPFTLDHRAARPRRASSASLLLVGLSAVTMSSAAWAQAAPGAGNPAAAAAAGQPAIATGMPAAPAGIGGGGLTPTPGPGLVPVAPGSPVLSGGAAGTANNAGLGANAPTGNAMAVPPPAIQNVPTPRDIRGRYRPR